MNSRKARIANSIGGFWQNVVQGLRASLLLKPSPPGFYISVHQWMALVLLLIAIDTTSDWVAAGPGRLFSYYGVTFQATELVASLVATYVAFLLLRGAALTRLLVSLTAASLLPAGVAILSTLTEDWIKSTDRATQLVMLGAVLGWSGLIIIRLLKAVTASGWWRCAVVTVVCALVSLTPALVLPHAGMWNEPYTAATSAEPALNTEDLLYAQRERVAEAVAGLQPGRPGVTDLYFVGLAGNDHENVFFRETRAIRTLFDERFDTRGRSVLLANHRDTVDELPLGTAHNLSEVLGRIGELMNPEEDILFLYLSSHGSEDHYFIVDLGLVPLNDIAPENLAAILTESGIRYRVVAISACYSGGFIDSLADEDTMIIAAAAPDRTSFGCGAKDEWTYFGEAMFDQALREQWSFAQAFEEAAETIAEREEAEGLTPSLPQVSAGETIAEALVRLEVRLASIAGSGIRTE